MIISNVSIMNVETISTHVWALSRSLTFLRRLLISYAS